MPSLLPTGDILETAIDYPRLMAKLDGDRDLFKEMVAIFMEEHPGWVEEIRRCIAAGSAADLFKIAHLVRGSAGHFGARNVTPLAASLECIGRTGALAEAEQYFQLLQTALEQLRATFEHFADDKTA